MMYLDHHAATPPAPKVHDAVVEALEAWANPSSVHAAGQYARRVVDAARTRVAESLDVPALDVVLTSGGTEACNLAAFGLARGKRRIVLSEVEHPAVVEPVERLSEHGDVEIVRLPVPRGVPADAGWLADRVDAESLVLVQLVNHETGTVFPVADYGAACRARGATLFVDASQALGKLPVRPRDLGAAAVAVSGAKVGALSGAGALYVERGVILDSLVVGGGQERGRRAGSPDILAHASFARALDDLGGRLSAMGRVRRFRDGLEAELRELGGQVNGVSGSSESDRVATVTNVTFPGLRGDLLVAALDVEGGLRV